MSGFKKFAVAGAGNFGKFIVKELLQLKNEGASVSVLTRSVRPILYIDLCASDDGTIQASNANSTELTELGVKVVEVDYESADSISKALTGVDVLICAFGSNGTRSSKASRGASQTSGSEAFRSFRIWRRWRGDEENSVSRYKLDVQKKLENIGLPYTLFQTGSWPDSFFTP